MRTFRFFIATLLVSLPFAARGEDTPFTEDNQRIMLVRLVDGTLITDALIAYPAFNSWFLPLGDLTANLGIAITARSGEGLADGSILDPLKTFKLNLASCSVELSGVAKEFPCDQAQANEGDIFVSVALLQEWLPLKFEINTFSSEILVLATRPLPLQERAERERRATFLKRRGIYDPGFPLRDVPREFLDGPIVDQQLTIEAEQNSDRVRASLRHDTSISGELFGMEAAGQVGGYTNAWDKPRLSLARRSTERNLLGPLRATEIQLVNLTLPNLPLIGGGRFGTGALISSFPLNNPDNYSSQTLEGELLAGWEVELYQNDTLIDRQISGDTGRYEFRSVPLYYGPNRFKLVFYGPQGQRREVLRSYSVDQNMQPPGVSSYRIGFANIDAQDDRVVFQVDTSVTKGVSARTGFARMMAPKLQTADSTGVIANYGLVGLTGALGPALLQTNLAASGESGSAGEAGVQASFGRSNLSVFHTVLNDFASDVFQKEIGRTLVASTKLEVATVPFVQPAMRMTLQARQGTYGDSSVRRDFIHRASLLTGQVFWNNEMALGFDAERTFGGQFFVNFLLDEQQLRFLSAYDNSRIRSQSIDWQKSFADQSTLRGSVAWNFQESLAELSGSFSHEFKDFTLTTQLSYKTSAVWNVGCVLSYNFAREPSGEWHLRSKPASGSGAASVLVYHDTDRDGKFTPSDRPMKAVGLKVAQRDLPERTDERGLIYLQNLAPHQANDLQIDLATLIDPYHKPLDPGARFFPRLGKTAEIEMPVRSYSDFSGSIIYPEHTKRGIEIELIDISGRVVATTKTESDGYYLFERVEPGIYSVRLKTNIVYGKATRVSPSQHQAKADFDGVSIGDLNFTLVE